jgi:hypothetical protein
LLPPQGACAKQCAAGSKSQHQPKQMQRPTAIPTCVRD